MGQVIELKEFAMQPCKSRQAFEFVPKTPLSLDLRKVAEVFRKHNVGVEVETDFLLMLQSDGHAVSLFKSGKIIVKNESEKDAARVVAEKILTLLN